MSERTYHAPTGGHPPQSELLTGRAVFTEAYAVIPKGVMRDIVTSALPFWEKTRSGSCRARCRALPRRSRNTSWRCSPAAAASGPSRMPAPRACSSSWRANWSSTLGGRRAPPAAGRICLPAAGERLDVRNEGAAPARFHWIRKAYEHVDGIEAPPPLSSPTSATSCRSPMPGTEGRWATTRFVDPDDLRHDMHVTIVTFEPGARHSLCRDPCHGARALRARRQGGLPPEPGLGRGRGRRLHVAARLLPAGLLCRRPRQLPLPPLQGRQPAHEARTPPRWPAGSCRHEPRHHAPNR